MKKMKKLLLLITLVAGVIAFALPAQATTVTFELDSSLVEDCELGTYKPNPDGDPWWLKAVFDDGGYVPGHVIVTLTADLGTSTTGDPNKVGLWYFNLDPVFDATLLSFTVQGSHSAPEADFINTDNTDSVLRADGDGYFDIEFDFPTTGSTSFNNSNSITYLITSAENILATSFNYKSVPGPGSDDACVNSWGTVAHIHSISQPNPEVDDSTWIGSEGGLEGEGDPVPEPATMLLLGSGLIGIAFGGKKRFKKTNE